MQIALAALVATAAIGIGTAIIAAATINTIDRALATDIEAR